MNTSVKIFVVLAFGLICLLTSASPLNSASADNNEPRKTGASSSPGAHDTNLCSGDETGLRLRLENLFSNQQSNGDIRFQGADSVFYYHPLMATLALELYRESHDPAILQQAQVVSKNYFNYLFIYHDVDGDFLIERSSTTTHYAPDLEDVGFNTMLALDMLSLSAICLELQMPVEALFWYQGAETISKRIVAMSFDADAGFFLPTRANARRRESLFFGLSALPVYFSQLLGDNISTSVIRNYVLNDQTLLPETPSHYVTGHFTDNELAATGSASRALRTRLLFGALERNSFDVEVETWAKTYQINEANTRQTAPNTPPSDALDAYTRCILSGGGPFAPFPEYLELDILDKLVFQKSLLDAAGTAELREAITDIRDFLTAGSTPPRGTTASDTESVVKSARRVYFGISALRERWKNQTLFNRNENSIVPGFDIYSAVSDLWDDVVETLKKAEDLASARRLSSDGLNLTATMLKETVAPGESIPVRFVVSTLGNAVAIRSIVVMTDQGVDTLFSADPPLDISASDTLHSFPYLYTHLRTAELGIHSFSLSAEIRFADGSSARRHFKKGVFVTKPVTFVVRFPAGTSLSEGTMPVEVDITKHRSFDSLINARWFSPVGLNPVEGPALEARMPAHVDHFTFHMNILVPNPCRPGSFPFTLKVLSNGEEVGVVSSHFFKHYRWMFVGPFADKLEGLDARFAPESRVNLFHNYQGAYGEVSWRPLADDAYADEGRITLDKQLPTGSVGFLYTVIETETPKTTTVFFGSDTPALLYINGNPIIRVEAGDPSPFKHARVALQQGLNDVMIKAVSREQPTVFFQLGNEEDLASDQFNNNLYELIDGYAELGARVSARPDDHGENPSQTKRQITLTYSDSEANSVSVVGTFNGWSGANTNMRKNNLGKWEISLFLSPGRYAYRFLVNNSHEILDPATPEQEPDGYGGHNSVLYVQ